MAEEFSHSILLKVVAQICQMVGFEKIMETSLLVLADILKEVIRKLGRIALQYGEHCGHRAISLRDLSLAFHDCGILPSELAEFLALVHPLPKSILVPQFPVQIKNPNTLHDSSDIGDSMEVESVPFNGGEALKDSRETLKIKISLSKIKEARTAKKKKKQKKKQKMTKQSLH